MMTSKALFALLAGLLLPAVSIAQTERVEAGTHELRMEFDGLGLRVHGGDPFNPCGIMLGLEEESYVLPGNALLSIKPLLMLSIGHFDANGEYEFDLEPLLSNLTEPIVVLAQAISIVEDSEFFKTSNVEMLGMLNERVQGPRTQDVDGDGEGDDNNHQDGDSNDADRDDHVPAQDPDQQGTVPTHGGDDATSAAKTPPIDNGKDTKPIDPDEPQSVDTKSVDGGVSTKPIGG